MKEVPPSDMLAVLADYSRLERNLAESGRWCSRSKNECRLGGRFVELSVGDAKRNGEPEYEAQYLSFVRDR